MQGLFSRRIVETPQGVYVPGSLRWEFGLATTFLLVLVPLLAVRSKDPVMAAIYVALGLMAIGVRVYRLRKYGRLGPPMVSVDCGRVLFAGAAGTRGPLVVPLDELQRVVVYGATGRRKFRLVKTDGSHVEAVPMWGRDLDTAAAAFLVKALPGRVTVEEPQTAFAAARGDEPVES